MSTPIIQSTPPDGSTTTGVFAAASGYPALTWSADRPAAAGWWWVRAPGIGPMCVLVFQDDDTLKWTTFVPGWGRFKIHMMPFATRWAGPLPEPQEPSPVESPDRADQRPRLNTMDTQNQTNGERGSALETTAAESGSTASAGSVIAAVVGEVDRATRKFPTWPTDPLHALGVLQEEAGELAKEVMQLTYEPHKSSREAVGREAMQTAAMALRFLMSLDRYEYERRPQHSQSARIRGEAPRQ